MIHHIKKDKYHMIISIDAEKVFNKKDKDESSIKSQIESSSQDGGIGRNASLPCTTKRRITTNLKTINNQNFQKIKLHVTPTTK